MTRQTMRSAYPTEIAGQYGSCLTDFLLVKNYEADGFIRRSSTLNTSPPWQWWPWV